MLIPGVRVAEVLAENSQMAPNFISARRARKPVRKLLRPTLFQFVVSARFDLYLVFV
jgi:hypothetical protein